MILLSPPTTGLPVITSIISTLVTPLGVHTKSMQEWPPAETRRWSAAASTSACAAAAARSAVAAARRAPAALEPPPPPPPAPWSAALQQRRAATRQALARQQCASSARWCSGLAWSEEKSFDISCCLASMRSAERIKCAALQPKCRACHAELELRRTPAAAAAASASTSTVQQPLVSPYGQHQHL
jgi:hypothetical protein